MIRRSLIIAICMLAASAGAVALRPSLRVADLGPKIDLETIVPKQFGDWRLEPDQAMQIVDPRQKEALDKLYAQTLSRTYVSTDGYRIMLSIAYGSDQTGGMQIHKPEICYPSQGFALWKNQVGTLTTQFGALPIRRLLATLNMRSEPITYWITIGDQVVKNDLEKRLIKLSYTLTGKIPDGLLFRVSSIDRDDAKAYLVQEKFITQLLQTATPDARKRLIGQAQAQ